MFKGILVDQLLIQFYVKVIEFHNNKQYQTELTLAKTVKMNIEYATKIFPGNEASLQLIKQLDNKNIQAQCSFTRPQLRNSSEMEDESGGETVLLQVVDQFIVQRAANGQIYGCVRCDYEIQFEIVRKVSHIPNRLGDAEGVRFTFKSCQDFVVQLVVKNQNRKNLENFGRVLGRKFIIQLGFHTSFKAVKKIGKGMTACVYNAINFANGREVAIKSFKRSVYFAQDNGNGKASFLNEFRILTQVNHKNLCQLLSVYETDNSTYVILELYPLSLYGYIQKCGFPALEQAKIIMINLLEGIANLHEKGIMHRDLKLENIMVKKQSNGRVIPVIVDFGLAEYTSNKKYLYTRCGTPGYVAPQVLKIKSSDPVQTYSSACDIFSLGVIFHILLFKKPLFEGKEVKQVIKKNCECEIDFNSDLFKSLNPVGRDLFEQMLCRDPSKRITAQSALSHPFFEDERKKLEIEMQNVYQTDYSIYA